MPGESQTLESQFSVRISRRGGVSVVPKRCARRKRKQQRRDLLGDSARGSRRQREIPRTRVSSLSTSTAIKRDEVVLRGAVSDCQLSAGIPEQTLVGTKWPRKWKRAAKPCGSVLRGRGEGEKKKGRRTANDPLRSPFTKGEEGWKLA